MKIYYWLIGILVCGLLLLGGCGRKGDPVIPEIPYPQAVRNLSADIIEQGIVLVWEPPLEYTTGKSLDFRKDIEKIAIFRKQEPSVINRWDFLHSNENWNSTGGSFPVKWHRGTIRALSKDRILFLLSPQNLSIRAEENRYLRLKLWTRNSSRGYIAFITAKDTRWDNDLEMTFQPAVHTSFYSYQRTFGGRKLASFPLISNENGTRQAYLHEYVIDMKKLPAWQGAISQIGILLQMDDPDEGPVEMGVDLVEFTNTLTPEASIYQSSPWMFLEDEEGWFADSPQTVHYGATHGVLYAQGTGGLLLLSAPGLNIPFDALQQIQIRLQVTEGSEAFLIFLGPRQRVIPDNENELLSSSSYAFRLALKDPTAFHTYTLYKEDLIPEANSGDGGASQEIISQIGIFFPALPQKMERYVFIDYAYFLGDDTEPGLLEPLLIQKEIPPHSELLREIQQDIALTAPDFDTPYEILPSNEGQTSSESVKLVEVSPLQPEPLMIGEDDTVTFFDTGNLAGFPLRHGEQYTYTIEMTDRKNRKNEETGEVTIGFARIARAPYGLKAESADGEIRLSWRRPFLTEDGKKIQSLTGYQIFRRQESEQYSATPLTQVSPNATSFLDTDVVNGLSYFYVIKALTPVTSSRYIGGLSKEVSAIPQDTEAPDIPSEVSGAYLGNSVNISWSIEQANDLRGFHIYRSDEPSGDFRRINSQPILRTSYQDTAVETQTTYFYYVTSFDDATPPNESPPSETISVRTPRRR